MDAAILAKALAYNGVRNSAYLEGHLHCGTVPESVTGDYSDVKVVTPYGEIPWPQVARISDAEMKLLMIDITDRLFTLLSRDDALGTRVPRYWQEPQLRLDLTREGLEQLLRRRDG
jgi:hypothetical protein